MLINTLEASRVLGVTQQMVRILIKNGKISARRNLQNGRFEILQNSVMKYKTERKQYAEKARKLGLQYANINGYKRGWYFNKKWYGENAKEALEKYNANSATDL